MYFRDARFWAALNALLAAVIIMLLLFLLLGQRRQSAGYVSSGRECNELADRSPTLLHVVNVEHVGLRPVSFSRIVLSSDDAEGWRSRGVQPQEWARLPASPGMDMAELPDGYLLTFSLPGVQNDDIRLSMTGCVMTVQAVVRDLHGTQVGGMERRVRLPRTSNEPADFKALFTNGVLRICVAK